MWNYQWWRACGSAASSRIGARLARAGREGAGPVLCIASLAPVWHEQFGAVLFG